MPALVAGIRVSKGVVDTKKTRMAGTNALP
jgi:hypothetical protein